MKMLAPFREKGRTMDSAHRCAILFVSATLFLLKTAEGGGMNGGAVAEAGTARIEKPQSALAGQPSEMSRYDCEDDLIEVMFVYESRVRLRGGGLVDERGGDLSGVREMQVKYPGSSWHRICDVPEDTIDELQANGEAQTGRSVYNMNNMYRLKLPPGKDVWEVCRELEALPEVLSARPVPKPAPPPLPPDYQSNQGYLEPASSTPTGIDAEYAWTQPGGTGSGVTIGDVEYGWTYSHVDLTKLVGSQINTNCGALPPDYIEHGTAVAGELIADNNGWGVTGICYGASIKTSCAYYGSPSPAWNVPGAITVAIATLSAGDVILLEQQWQYKGVNDFVPIEWWGDVDPSPQTYNGVYAAIVNAVSNGIHIVEAAGNGYYDLDSLTWYGDSGAIIVGAGGAYPGGYYAEGDLQRLSFSDYGARVNVQGWGEDVYTAGYGDLYSAEGANYYYTSSFSGTSSASPIVAGAVACCVGYWTAGLGQPAGSLTPEMMRDILVSSGTPQVMPPAGNIGPRPNLYGAFELLRAMVPTPIPTNTPTNTPTITPTITPTATPGEPTATPVPPTPYPTSTPYPTWTPPPTEPTAQMALNGTTFSPGSPFTATFVLNRPIERPFTVFAVVFIPDGFMLDALTLGPNIKPLASNVPRLDAPFRYPLISLNLPTGAPLGQYEVVAAFFDPNGPITGRGDAFLDVSAKFNVY